MTKFVRILQTGWGDMDYNAHMRNTAYLDKSADVRMIYFQENGFPMSEFERLKIGPVIMKDELEYFKELKLLEEVSVSLELAGLSEDGTRVRLRNVFTRTDGKIAAKVTSTLGWLDLASRRLVAPPEKLLSVLTMLERAEDFSVLTSSAK
jgi:acyl-CoA thioester hydrolase